MKSPSTARVVLLVSALSLRRLVNRIAHLRTRASRAGRRSATARKATGGKLLLGFMAITFMFQAVMATVTLVHSASVAAEKADNAGFEVVNENTLELVRWADQIRQSDPSGQEPGYRDALSAAFEQEGHALKDAAARRERERALMLRFERQGESAFRPSTIAHTPEFRASALWYRGKNPEVLLKPLALVAMFLGLAVALQHLAAERDLAKVDAGLEWLFSFPVSARSLFLSRALEAAFVGPLVWVLIFPFYSVVFWCAGYGALGVALGAGAALYTGGLAGALRVVTETTLRRCLSLTAVARVQSVLLVLSYVALAISFAAASSSRMAWLTTAASSLPVAALYTPLSLPLWLVLGGRAAWLTLLGAVLLLLILLSTSVWLAGYMVRDGITSGSGNLVAARAAGRPGAPVSSTSLGGVALKELRAVLRDRQLRTQALVAPIVLVLLQLWLNPSIVSGVFGNPRHVATAAFAFSMLLMTTGACGALATEGPALWLLYTVPVRLERLLIAKLTVWIALAFAFSSVVLGLVGFRSPALLLATAPYLLLVVPGIALYAVIAFGLGTLATDPLEAEPRRRVRVGSVHLFMILASMFAYALYVPSWWAKFVQLTLSALLAFALWQKVKDHAPFLLDPSEAPPPRIGVADGVMAALGFFVLQGLMQLALARYDVPPGQALLVGFVTAGSLVAIVSLLIFTHSGVPDLARTLGLRLPAGSGWFESARALGLGLGAGLAAAAFALAYLALCERVPFLRALRDETLQFSKNSGHAPRGSSLVVLAVFAAPLFEEFIFRGILYRGLRRSLSTGAAALASAVVFALVHPALAAAPVFVLALLAALAYERSRWLAAPVVAHLVYNAVVVGSAMRQH